MSPENNTNAVKAQALLDKIIEAVAHRDGRALGSYLSQMRMVGGGHEALAGALADCALDIMPYTGYDVIIYSDRLQREVVLGRDISWSALQDLIRVKPKTESLATMLTAASELQGQIEQVLPLFP